LRSLEQATARLADLHPGDAEPVQRALAERSLAIDAISCRIAVAGEALRPDGLELANQLLRDLETGAEILLRLALDREVTRLDLANLGRERQLLQSLSSSTFRKPNTIDQQG
jgi:hypothetical protein